MSYADVRIFLGGAEFTARSWIYVPRVGDEIMLGPDGARKAFRVIRVVWGNEREGWHPIGQGPQRVNIEVEHIDGGPWKVGATWISSAS